MYRFSPDLDLSQFVSAELQQICVGKFDVQFRFGSGAWIAVQSTVRIAGGRSSAQWSEGSGWTSTEFQALLNVQVVAAEVTTDQQMELRFANGLVLQLSDSSDQYESMQIYFPGAPTPVVV